MGLNSHKKKIPGQIVDMNYELLIIIYLFCVRVWINKITITQEIWWASKKFGGASGFKFY